MPGDDDEEEDEEKEDDDDEDEDEDGRIRTDETGFSSRSSGLAFPSISAMCKCTGTVMTLRFGSLITLRELLGPSRSSNSRCLSSNRCFSEGRCAGGVNGVWLLMHVGWK